MSLFFYIFIQLLHLWLFNQYLYFSKQNIIGWKVLNKLMCAFKYIFISIVTYTYMAIVPHHLE